MTFAGDSAAGFMNERSLRPTDDQQQTCRVITDYRAAYPDPIIVSTGDELIFGEGDPEYPGWVWCTDGRGKGGWAPDDCIERTRAGPGARYDYAATELSANAGDELIMSREKSGWAWCTNGQSGWLPVANLERTTET